MPPVRGPAPKNLRILLVDRDWDAAELLARLLRAAGYVVDQAASEVSAVALVNDCPPNILLVDVGTPGDGCPLARQLLSLCPVKPLFIATSAERLENQQCLRDFDHYLVKPVDLDNLTNILEQFAASR